GHGEPESKRAGLPIASRWKQRRHREAVEQRDQPRSERAVLVELPIVRRAGARAGHVGTSRLYPHPESQYLAPDPDAGSVQGLELSKDCGCPGPVGRVVLLDDSGALSRRRHANYDL